MKKFKEINKLSIMIVIMYLLLSTIFYYIQGNNLYVTESKNNIEYGIPVSTVGEVLNTSNIEQEFTVDADNIESISIKIATYGRKNNGNLLIKILDKSSNVELMSKTLDQSTMHDNSDLVINCEEKVKNIRNKELILQISSDTDNKDNAITIYQDNNKTNQSLTIDGQYVENTLMISTKGIDDYWLGHYYWYIVIIGFIIISAYFINVNIKLKKGKECSFVKFIESFKKYKFLLCQLIDRDFKSKYKRSVLGILWSFLNPLLTMIVQYIVFSTIFKTDIPYYPVYLLIGIVVFNFFTESCAMGLMSIVGNASLITKVYVPKCIYPISKVFSSVINMLLSLIPLIIVILITGINIKYSIVLTLFAFICIIVFCIGMSFILSSAMVFFRDTQFLWNVISLLWMYATPIFYPETIISGNFSIILKLNPLYHFIRFIRTCIINGVTPEPKAYFYCLVFSLGTFFVGKIIFKKTQDKFVLNI